MEFRLFLVPVDSRGLFAGVPHFLFMVENDFAAIPDVFVANSSYTFLLLTFEMKAIRKVSVIQLSHLYIQAKEVLNENDKEVAIYDFTR